MARRTNFISGYSYSDGDIVGRGAYGVVYKGVRLSDQEPVAIKQVPLERVKQRELEVVQALECPSIIRIHDVLERADSAYVIMELCDCTLEDHLNALEPDSGMCSRNVRTVAMDLASGYVHLFNKHIIHRDIKPENVLLRYAPTQQCECGETHKLIGQVKLADFGNSRVSRKSMSNLCGTPLYMAPEVGANSIYESEYTHKVDMWSIGVLLFQCLAGKVPFDENQLCRLFLQSSQFNHGSYKCPSLPAYAQANDFYKSLITRLLDINVKTRIDAPELYEILLNEPFPDARTLKLNVYNYNNNKLALRNKNDDVLSNGHAVFQAGTSSDSEPGSPEPERKRSPSPAPIIIQVPCLRRASDQSATPTRDRVRETTPKRSWPRLPSKWLWSLAKTVSLHIVYNCNTSLIQIAQNEKL